jgi:hypothetical protein
VTVLGLADLGNYQEQGYSSCYQEDRDNYVDIILQVEDNPSALEDIEAVQAFQMREARHYTTQEGQAPCLSRVFVTLPLPYPRQSK